MLGEPYSRLLESGDALGETLVLTARLQELVAVGIFEIHESELGNSHEITSSVHRTGSPHSDVRQTASSTIALASPPASHIVCRA